MNDDESKKLEWFSVDNLPQNITAHTVNYLEKYGDILNEALVIYENKKMNEEETNMIDLHMHTKYSDGTDSVKEILSNANKTNLEIISITDHNTCNAYKEMETLQVTDFFNGKIIIGCEFTTAFDNRLIEVLGYGFDYYKVNEYLNRYYTAELINQRTTILYNRLIEKISNLGLICNLENIREKKFDNEFFERGIYEELKKHSKNITILQEDIWESFSDFFI